MVDYRKYENVLTDVEKEIFLCLENKMCKFDICQKNQFYKT